MYTITKVAEICDLSTHTLRFYDKEGLLPFISRNENGNRQFSEGDLEFVKLICCLKNSGMPIKDIRYYMNLITEGETTLNTRNDIMKSHRQEILRQINELKKSLNIIDLKIAYYHSTENKRKEN